MADNTTTADAVDENGDLDVEDVESLSELAISVIWDGIFGAIAGAAGNVVMLGTLFLASMIGLFELESFAAAAEILGLTATFAEAQMVTLGAILFIVGGMTVLPLLLATTGLFLPGDDYATRGLSFGVIVWTGFVLAYYPGYSGTTLLGYALVTLLGHLGYGYVTGAMMDRLFAEEGRPVIAQSVREPALAMEEATGAEGKIPREKTTLVDDADDRTDDSQSH